MPAEVSSAALLELPRFRAPQHELSREIASNYFALQFVRKNFANSIFHSPGPIAGGRVPRHAVVTLHDCIYRTFPKYLGRFLIRRSYVRATERFAKNASLVLTDSVFSKRELVEKVGVNPDRLEILYPWVGNEFLEPIAVENIVDLRLRLNLPNRFWLYVGGYDYRKNVEFLLEAYGKARKKGSMPALVLAGNVPTHNTRTTCDVVGTIKRLGLKPDEIVMPGFIDVDQLPLLYKAASLLIYPSLMEGFGLPPAEAMAAGTPVLSANTSSLPEVVRNPISLFDPTETDQLAEKLMAADRKSVV